MRKCASFGDYISDQRFGLDRKHSNSSWDTKNGTAGIENRLLTHSILSRRDSITRSHLNNHRQSNPPNNRQQSQSQSQQLQNIHNGPTNKVVHDKEEGSKNHEDKSSSSSSSLTSKMKMMRVVKNLNQETMDKKEVDGGEVGINGDLIVNFPSVKEIQPSKNNINGNKMIKKLASLFPSSNSESPSSSQHQQQQPTKMNHVQEQFQQILSSSGNPTNTLTNTFSPPTPQRNDNVIEVDRNQVELSRPVLTEGSKRKSLNDLTNNHDELPVLFEDPTNDMNSKSKMKKFAEQAKAMPQLFDELETTLGYESVPLLEIDHLPRGGLSIDTSAVGRIQFGIPPETIKDSMRLGIEVPKFYIVPTERFCREMGPALGINLSEFEFPAYFNYFVNQNQCTLVVDSESAENNIREVFGETLLGPAQFRNHKNPTFNEDEDFDPSYPKDARPNFYKEFNWFRKNEKTPNFDELCLNMLIKFQHFTKLSVEDRKKLGVPPPQADYFPNSASNLAVHNTDFYTSRNSLQSRFTSSSKNFDDSLTSSLTTNTKGFSSINNNNATVTASIISAPSQISKCRANFDCPPLKRSHSNPNLSNRNLNVDDIQFLMGDCDDNNDNDKGQGHSRDSTSLLRRNDSNHSIDSQVSLPNEESSTDVSQRMWMYSKVTWLGEVATVYPSTATPEEIENNSCARVEIFKLAGGTEYVVHDVNENNVIEGKARFTGSVSVPDEIEVEGFTTMDTIDDVSIEEPFNERSSNSLVDTIVHINVPRKLVPPTFHPPSFGVTVLGNSHGFNKNGSVSGYVLWVNGRGVMIDPPPYSSATLEREGIRPRMIMAIIITHCHADHDAGAFQKVMTGSRVALITTPTIYKSFIRKYAALSGLSPELLRHSHRYRPAIIGQPLKFQGATFQFNYTLHTIPCIAFRVEWKGRSIVFTGDHMNIPGKIDELEKMGVLAKARADKIRNLPLQECDLLLHESGAPPIHTPLEVLLELPEEVKRRLFVVHTAELPKDCELRVAPTGTRGTIRLDGFNSQDNINGSSHPISNMISISTMFESQHSHTDNTCLDSYRSSSLLLSTVKEPSSVNLRPTCVSDAWFILNLLSVVPFFSSLSYASTMDVLEMAQVETFEKNEIVLSRNRRNEVLCVIWEGKCMNVERASDYDMASNETEKDQQQPTFWHAGDWTGPQILQPEVSLSGECCMNGNSKCQKDIVAVSEQGVKVILLNMTTLHGILNSGSPLYRKYLSKIAAAEEEIALRKEFKVSHDVEMFMTNNVMTGGLFDTSTRSLEESSHKSHQTTYNFMDILMENSALSCLTAVQIRHLESLAEGPQKYDEGDLIWQYGHSTEYAFIIASGTAKFVDTKTTILSRRSSTGSYGSALKPASLKPRFKGHLSSSKVKADKQIVVSPNSEYAKLERILKGIVSEHVKNPSTPNNRRAMKQQHDRKSRHKFANKVLARLNSRNAYTEGLIFSKGHFLSDTSRMVRGSLAGEHFKTNEEWTKSLSEAKNNKDVEHFHTSNLAAGSGGCSVLFFPRENFISFLDSHPGVLLTLLGSQVIV